jgi:hypothetical protein
VAGSWERHGGPSSIEGGGKEQKGREVQLQGQKKLWLVEVAEAYRAAR